MPNLFPEPSLEDDELAESESVVDFYNNLHEDGAMRDIDMESVREKAETREVSPLRILAKGLRNDGIRGTFPTAIYLEGKVRDFIEV